MPAGAYCCRHCEVNWPPQSAGYGRCPFCDRNTIYNVYEDPLDDGTAAAMVASYVAQKMFDDYYVDYAVQQLYMEIDAWLNTVLPQGEA